MSTNRWSRRGWMQTVALGLSTPLLTPFIRQAAAQDAGVMPRRFVIVVAGNGIESALFKTPALSEAIAAGGGSLDGLRFNFNREYTHAAPLEIENPDISLAAGLNALAGGPNGADLRGDAAVIFGLSSKIAGGGHASGYGALSSSASRGGIPTGPSIDAWLSRAPLVEQGHPFSAVRLGVSPDVNRRLQYSVCAFSARRPAPVMVDPSVAYTALFGSVGSGRSQQAFADRSALLDFARRDVRRALEAFRGGGQERQKLETYLESLETLAQRQVRLTAAEARLRQVLPTGERFENVLASPHPLERLDAQFELATAALLGALTPVVVLTCGAGDFNVTYSGLEAVFREDPNYRGLVDRHTVCHEAAGNPTYQRVLDIVTTRQVELIARMARRLKSVEEGDGTMLDHTAFVFMPDNGDQHHSPSSEWPMLLLGGRQLGLRTGGRTVVYPAEGQAGHRQVSNLFNTLGWSAGSELNTFGNEAGTRVAAGPLSELWS